MSTGVTQGNALSVMVMSATVDLGSVAANTTEEETATLTGVKVGDYVAVSKSDLDAGLLLGTCRVTADDAVSIQVSNSTAGAIDAAAETMTFLVVRPEGNTAATTFRA